MNSFDLFEALTDIDDDLIMNAQFTPSKKRHIRRLSLRIAAVACVICLSALTATAITIGVQIRNSSEVATNYNNFLIWNLSVSSKVTTVEYQLCAQDITPPLQWEDALTSAWKGFGYSYEHFSGIHLQDDDGNRIKFESIAEIEQLLGISLVYSEELEEITKGAYVTLAVTDHIRAAEQFRREGIVTPDGLIIYLPFVCNKQNGFDPELVDYCGLNIFVPLTDSFAEKYAFHPVLSSVYGQDLRRTSMVADSNLNIVILENTVEDDAPLSGYAAWEHKGIGYLVEMKTNWSANTCPGEILIPYLKTLEE